MREGPHIARTLNIVLSAQWVHTDPFAAYIAGRHGQVSDTDDGR